MKHSLIEQLERRCEQTIPEIFAEFGASVTKDKYIYIDNGKPLLAVAHLDTVYTHEKENIHGFPDKYIPSISTNKDGEKRITSLSLDDRLGVFAILDYLPDLFGGYQYDILLTIDEEIGATSARDFTTDKEYRWIFEFDRTGTDVVFYQYHAYDWIRAVNKHFPKIGSGSFSDVSALDNLGACAVNFGVGYHNAHTFLCYADLKDFEDQMNRFQSFYNDNFYIKYPWNDETKCYCVECKTTPIRSDMHSTTVSMKCKKCAPPTKQYSYVYKPGQWRNRTKPKYTCDYCENEVSKGDEYYIPGNNLNTKHSKTSICGTCLKSMFCIDEVEDVSYCMNCDVISIWNNVDKDGFTLCPVCSSTYMYVGTKIQNPKGEL